MKPSPESPESPTPASRVQCSYASPLGRMTLAASAQGLCGCWFQGQKHMPPTAHWPQQEAHPVLRQAVAELERYFAGLPLPRSVREPLGVLEPLGVQVPFILPLDLNQGSAFQQQVWRALLAIAPGQTRTYGQIAQGLGKAAAVRAVGAAIGRNPLSIFVPCHRVVGANGALTGYAGGLERKQALLHLERTGTARRAPTGEDFAVSGT